MNTLVNAHVNTHVNTSVNTRGASPACPTPRNREIDFAFVSCSCRACERAGEAKLRGRVRGVPPHRWALGLQIMRPVFE